MFYSYMASRRKVLVTAAVGGDYFARWKRRSWPSWKAFADRHGFGILCLEESLVGEAAHPGWNKFKLLNELGGWVPDDAHLVIMDADQIISPLAPDLSGAFTEKKIGVVPQNYGRYQKILSFLRRAHLDPEYPLDSMLLEGPGFPDFYSAGLITVPAANRSDLAEFSVYGPEDPSSEIDGGGDQMPFLNFLSTRKIHLLPTEWQGIWPQILATRYPFLYLSRDKELSSFALASALTEFHCVHFSTTWPEKDFWDIEFQPAWEALFPSTNGATSLKDYITSAVKPVFYGQLKPPPSFFNRSNI